MDRSIAQTNQSEAAVKCTENSTDNHHLEMRLQMNNPVNVGSNKLITQIKSEAKMTFHTGKPSGAKTNTAMDSRTTNFPKNREGESVVYK